VPQIASSAQYLMTQPNVRHATLTMLSTPFHQVSASQGHVQSVTSQEKVRYVFYAMGLVKLVLERRIRTVLVVTQERCLNRTKVSVS
jgi:hypothetical protein